MPTSFILLDWKAASQSADSSGTRYSHPHLRLSVFNGAIPAGWDADFGGSLFTIPQEYVVATFPPTSKAVRTAAMKTTTIGTQYRLKWEDNVGYRMRCKRH